MISVERRDFMGAVRIGIGRYSLIALSTGLGQTLPRVCFGLKRLTGNASAMCLIVKAAQTCAVTNRPTSTTRKVHCSLLGRLVSDESDHPSDQVASSNPRVAIKNARAFSRAFFVSKATATSFGWSGHSRSVDFRHQQRRSLGSHCSYRWFLPCRIRD